MSRRHLYDHWPVVLGRCADCSIGTYTIGEWYMVRDEVWERAWAGRRKPWHALPGQEILCIGCLEKRLGRTLKPSDFTDSVEGGHNQKSTRRSVAAKIRSNSRKACARPIKPKPRAIVWIVGK
jgi:hypothetical protein